MKKIVLGVTGSIAAYKAAELIRLFVKNGDEVHVIMTKAATKFIAPLTLQTLSKNPVAIDMFEKPRNWEPWHISLANLANLVLIAPATANTIAKIRQGLADNMLTTIALATKAPIAIAPAMNEGMWANPITQENISALTQRGVMVISPREGELACGISGQGRMAEPLTIFKELK